MATVAAAIAEPDEEHLRDFCLESSVIQGCSENHLYLDGLKFSILASSFYISFNLLLVGLFSRTDIWQEENTPLSMSC